MVVGRTMSRVTVSTVTSEGYGRTIRRGIEDTSASFEARSAPRSYPTIPNHAVSGLQLRRLDLLTLDPELFDDRPPFLDIGFLHCSECVRRLLFARENI